MKKTFLLGCSIVLIVIVLAGLYKFSLQQRFETIHPASLSASVSSGVATSSVVQTATASSGSVKFEVVTTQAAQERGLGGRVAIPDNYAMLFVFPNDGLYGFWMKDMRTPIDMVWLADDGSIVKIDSNVPADSYPKVFYPPQPVKYVLETKVGLATERDWSVGTRVELPKPY